jgi:hypothetical protein
MKTYVAVTGTVFALLALAHLWRLYEEGAGPTRTPFFVVITVLAAGFAVWAWRLVRKGDSSSAGRRVTDRP